MKRLDVSADEIISYLQEKKITFQYLGREDVIVRGYSSLNNYEDGTITWCKSLQGNNDIDWAKIGLCVVQDGTAIPVKNQIVCVESKKVFFMILEHFWGEDNISEGSIGENTVIGEYVTIGKNVVIGNNCSISGIVHIGENTRISDNVVIKGKANIGRNCVIQAFVVIGEDGFGYYEEAGYKKKMIKHYGGVIIGDEVFIGAHTNIAKGTIGDTIISDGVKIAPSTHIGHNGYLGDDAVVICSQLYGSVKLGKDAYVVGSIVKNQTIVNEHSMVGMGSIVTKNVEKNTIVVGAPAKAIRERY